MMKELLARANLALAFLIFLLDRFAQTYSWYWQYPWFDVYMHVAGGFFVALSGLYIYYYSGYITPRHQERFFAITLAVFSALFIGIMWEFFEFAIDVYTKTTINGITVMNQKIGDTLGDLAADMVGALSAAFIFISLWQKK